MATTGGSFDFEPWAAPVDANGPLALGLSERGVGNVSGRPSLSLADAVQRLTRDGLSWGALGQPTTVTWGMRTTSGTMPEGTSGFTAFGPSQSIQLYFILQAWADVANVVFQNTGDTASILFGNYSSGAEGAGAFAFLPGSRDAASSAGDVWVNSSISYNQTPSSTNYGWFTLLHEIGHALGLSHPGDYEASANGVLTYANNAGYYEDSNQYTVMSYFGVSSTGARAGSAFPLTPMIDDIAAIQRLYGANMNTRTGDDVYGNNTNQSLPWFLYSADIVPQFAVWDAGGTDTFDFSGYNSVQTIDLRQGAFSSVRGGSENVSIAVGAVIENAVGGSGADYITGGSADNRISPGAGTNYVDGGLGNDTVVLTGRRADYTIAETQYGHFVSRAGEVTRLYNVEFLVFSDTFILVPALSDSAARAIGGDATDDTIVGAAGADLLNGGEGDDRLMGMAGDDTLTGGRGSDTISGGDGTDRIEAGAGNDIMDGGAGNDTIDAGSGDDLINGGDGIDTLVFAGTTAIAIDLLTGRATGRGSDTLLGIENVTGSSAGDRIRGDALGNVLDGGTGQDVIWGGGGNDHLRGGTAVVSFAPELIKSSYVANNSVGAAVAIDAFFSIKPDGATQATIQATSHGGLEYYACSVPTQNAYLYVDIDNATFDSTIRVFNAAGVQVASNDDGAEPGESGNPTDSYLRVLITTPGTYYIQVGQWAPAVTGFATQAPPSGGAYTLQVSGGVAASVIQPVTVGSAVFGEAGDDNIAGDYAFGGAGADEIATYSTGILSGGAGDDTLTGVAGSTAIYSGRSSDYVISRVGATGQYRVTGLDGVDLVTGVTFLRFDDRTVRLDYTTAVLNGGAGADALTISAARTQITGGGGADTIRGGGGGTEFRYLAASDSTAAAYDTLLNFITGSDVINLAAANPTSISLVRSGASTFVFAETAAGNMQILVLDRLLSGNDINHDGAFGVFVIGTDARDELVGSYRPDSIVGGLGSDIITGGRGGDALSGGAGADIFRYRWAEDSDASNGVDNLYDFETGIDYIDLTALQATSISIIRSDNGSSFVFAETPLGGFLTTAAGRAINGGDFHYGGGFGIYMVGSANSDILTGTSLADPIVGGAGDDIIIGGGGADALFGDAGADLFVYRSVLDSLEGAADGIFGFVSGQDRIDLSGLRNSAADVFGIAYLGTGSFLFVDIGGDGYNELVIQLANTTLLASDINWGSPPPSAAPAGSPTGGVGLTLLDDETFEPASWSPLIGRTGGSMEDLDGVWAHGRHGPDWYL